MTPSQSHSGPGAASRGGNASTAGTLALRGERLCLDFTNTKSGRGTASEREHLRRYDDLLAWAEHANVLSAPHAAALRKAATDRPAEAHFVLEEAIELREAMHRLFSAIADEASPPERDVIALNRWLGQSYPHLTLKPSDQGFTLGWPEIGGDLASVLWPIVGSAADLLTQAKLDRVKRCPGWDCGWLFFDTTKNGTRRWCDMATCGNREKSRLHYRRRHSDLRCE
jgi:predicted RNA-binding Zn ribbon-like protein